MWEYLEGIRQFIEWSPFAPLGAVLLIAFCWMIGGRRVVKLKSARAAEACVRREYPEFEPKAGLLSRDRTAAVLMGTDGTAAVVYIVGDALAARRVRPGDVARVKVQYGKDVGGDGTLVLQLRDAGLPKVTLQVPHDKARRWAEHLEELTRWAA